MSTTKSYPRHWLGAHKAHLATGCVTMTGISDGTSATAGQYRSRQAASRPSSLTPVLVWVVLLVLAAIAWAVNRIPGPEHEAFPPLARAYACRSKAATLQICANPERWSSKGHAARREMIWIKDCYFSGRSIANERSWCPGARLTLGGERRVCGAPAGIASSRR